jgi:hypothetical protein
VRLFTRSRSMNAGMPWAGDRVFSDAGDEYSTKTQVTHAQPLERAAIYSHHVRIQ